MVKAPEANFIDSLLMKLESQQLKFARQLWLGFKVVIVVDFPSKERQLNEQNSEMFRCMVCTYVYIYI